MIIQPAVYFFIILVKSLASNDGVHTGIRMRIYRTRSYIVTYTKTEPSVTNILHKFLTMHNIVVKDIFY